VVGQLEKANVGGRLPKLVSDLFPSAIEVGKVDNGYFPFDLPAQATKSGFQIQFFQGVFFCSFGHCASRHIVNE